MRLFKPLLLIIFSLVYFTSCQKEITEELAISNSGGGGGTGGGNGGGTTNPACTSTTVMKIKRVQALFDDSTYVATTWNGAGGIQSIKYHQPLSEYRTANYIYQNGRITQAILLYEGRIYDTALFRYNAAGFVDSMYLRNNNNFDLSLTYANGKLTKVTSYARGMVQYYWLVQTDAKGNVTSATEWWNDTGGFVKHSVYTYTRDDRKNPFKDFAPYMFYLDDEYSIFREWGTNNYTSQRYQDFTGMGIDVLTGLKFKYNDNCYPATSQQTLAGQVLFPDDDFLYTYY